MNFFGMGPGELILILIVALIVFGPGKLPEIGSALGKGIREFKSATREMTSELTQSVNEVRQPIEEIRRPVNEVRHIPLITDTVPGAQTASVNRICPRCSAHNPSSNKFCGNCGAELSETEIRP